MLPTTKPKMAYYIRDIYLTSSKNPKLIPGLKTEKKNPILYENSQFFCPTLDNTIDPTAYTKQTVVCKTRDPYLPSRKNPESIQCIAASKTRLQTDRRNSEDFSAPLLWVALKNKSNFKLTSIYSSMQQ
jgi:hypothetical protein